VSPASGEGNCYDFATVGRFMAGDLSANVRGEMVGFVKRVLLTQKWMRAQSKLDVAAEKRRLLGPTISAQAEDIMQSGMTRRSYLVSAAPGGIVLSIRPAAMSGQQLPGAAEETPWSKLLCSLQMAPRYRSIGAPRIEDRGIKRSVAPHCQTKIDIELCWDIHRNISFYEARNSARLSLGN
jgi:hypothetical protein